MKLIVKSERTVNDLQTLLNAKTAREISFALAGFRFVPIRKERVGRIMQEHEWRQDPWLVDEAYQANAN